MSALHVPTRIDSFLTHKLSGSLFTWRDIFELLIPGILDSLSIMFINTLITALISKNGEASVAAVALVGPITGLISCVFNGVSAGGTVIVAQSLGKKDMDLVRKSVAVTLILTVTLGILVCIPFLLFPHAILELLYPSAEPIVMEKAMTFLSGCVWSILVFTLYTACFAVLRGLGESKRCLYLSVIINVAYFLLSVLFLNFLHLDIQGSVLALFWARVIGAVCAVVLLYFLRPPVKIKASQVFLFDRNLALSALKVGIPLGFEQVCMSLGNIVAEMYMILLGTTALATHAIANSLLGLVWSPAAAAQGLAVTVVGRCFGAGEYEEARRYGRRSAQIATILMLLSGLVFYPLLPLLLPQYNPTPEAADMASRLLYFTLPFAVLFWPGSFTHPSTLRACNDTLFPSVVSMAVLWLITIALGYVLAIPAGLGLLGTWIAMWASWVVRSVTFQLRMRGNKWMKVPEV